VKQADSIAARGSCTFLGVLLRDDFDLCHAVKMEIQKYVTLRCFLWLALYFLNSGIRVLSVLGYDLYLDTSSSEKMIVSRP